MKSRGVKKITMVTSEDLISRQSWAPGDGWRRTHSDLFRYNRDFDITE